MDKGPLDVGRKVGANANSSPSPTEMEEFEAFLDGRKPGLFADQGECLLHLLRRLDGEPDTDLWMRYLSSRIFRDLGNHTTALKIAIDTLASNRHGGGESRAVVGLLCIVAEYCLGIGSFVYDLPVANSIYLHLTRTLGQKFPVFPLDKAGSNPSSRLPNSGIFLDRPLLVQILARNRPPRSGR